MLIEVCARLPDLPSAPGALSLSAFDLATVARVGSDAGRATLYVTNPAPFGGLSPVRTWEDYARVMARAALLGEQAPVVRVSAEDLAAAQANRGG